MILLHRITSFVIAALSFVLFYVLLVAPHLVWIIAACFAVVALLFARLLLWEGKKPSFWVFWGTPLYLLGISILFFLFLEQEWVKILLTLFVTGAIWLYAENLFTFYHLPANYQAYALEYLTVVIALASVFFLASSAYGAFLFLQLPVWVPGLAMFWGLLGLTISAFWASKIHWEASGLYGFFGALMLTELFVAISALPTSFFVNAGVLTVFYYMYIGLARAHVLEKLTKTVLRRYVVTGAILSLALFITATWI